MMHSVPKAPETGWRPPLFIRLLRIWHARRSRGVNPLPAMTRLVAKRGCSPELTLSCDSCFALTEAFLGRRLDVSIQGAAALTNDEIGLIKLVRHAPMLDSLGPNAALPHGLPGALQWSAMAVLRALGPADNIPAADGLEETLTQRHCPF